VLAKTYKTGKILNEEGEVQKFSAAVGPMEGFFLYNLVKENKLSNCLEVGMANGMSSLFICQALADIGESGTPTHLISIDPFQSTQWKNQGRIHIKRAGLSEFSTVMEEPSMLAMPKLLQENYDGKRDAFDMIFIDGMHLFDYTLVDIFYADFLLRVGGVMVIDDVRHKSVIPAIEYIKKNYRHYKYINRGPKTVGVFLKIGKDTRDWDFHMNF